MTAVAVYLLVGSIAGLAAGLLGVGGGFIIVPALAHLQPQIGVAPQLHMQLAIGTSLASIVATSLASIYAHQRRGAVLWSAVSRLTPGILAGAALGAVVVDALPSAALRMIFGAFAILIAAQMWFGATPDPHRQLPGRLGAGLGGAVIGLISAVVGIGGGGLTVSYLLWCNVAMRQAVATAAAGGLPIALGGSLSMILLGHGRVGLPPWSSGYVYWPAVLGIVLASVATAPLGARLAHSLPTPVLKKVFALFLALVGVKMLW